MTTTRRLKIVVDQDGNAEGRLGGILSKLGGLKAVGPAAAGGLALVGGAALGAGGFLVSLGSDAEEMQGKFNVVFGETANQVTKDLDTFGNAVGRNKFELMGMASTLGDTLKPLGFTGEALDDTTVSLVKLATDLGSFNNMPMDEALRRLQGTLIGSHENALAFGVVINENTLKQELARMGAEELTGAQLEQAKVQARINLLMAGTTDAQGDAARTSGSWANQMRALKAELSEAATSMGAELLPVVTPFLKDAVQLAKDIMPKAVAIFKEFAGDLQANVGPAIQIANDAITRIAQAFGVNTDEVTAGDAALAAFKAVLDAFIIAIQAGAIALQGIAWAVEKVREAVDIARGLVHNFGIIMEHSFGGARNAINDLIDRWRRFKDAVRDAVDVIPDWLLPGSPTPFEQGLRGIANATREVESRLPSAFAVRGGGFGGAGGLAAVGGGTPIIVQLTYSPVISTADRYEAEQVLAPFIGEGVRRYLAGLI